MQSLSQDKSGINDEQKSASPKKFIDIVQFHFIKKNPLAIVRVYTEHHFKFSVMVYR